MGYLKNRYEMTLFGKTPDGTCPECGVKHVPALPHNKDSLVYQYKFYDEHGRFPTWNDAMAHCSEDVQKLWKQALSERGVEV